MSDLPHDKRAFLSLHELKSRGWSRRLVAQYLGSPDEVSSKSRAGRPSSLYLESRVRRVECTQVVLAREFEQVRGFVARNQRVALDKRGAMHRLVDSIPLPALNDELSEIMASLRISQRGKSPSAERQLAVELLLGTLVSSVDALGGYSWHAGVCDARNRLQKRLLAHIAQTYPLLEAAVSLMDVPPTG
jgi:hypothetical protein